MVLDKLPVLGRPTSLDNSRARAYCACSRCRYTAKNIRRFYGNITGNQLPVHFPFLRAPVNIFTNQAQYGG